MKKFVVTAVIIALAIAFICVLPTDVALADATAIIYPDHDYVQLERIDIVDVNADYAVFVDNVAKKVAVKGERYFEFELPSEALSVRVVDDVALFEFEDGYFSVTLTAQAPILSAVTIPDECTYLTDDGAFFYAHFYGSIKKFDKSLNLVDTYQNNAFKNLPVFGVRDGVIFAFAVSAGKSFAYTYDTEQQTTVMRDFEYVESVAVADDIFTHNGTEIVIVNDDFSPFVTNILSHSYTAFAGKLYVADGENGCHVYSRTNGEITYDGTISISGDVQGKLRTPLDAVQFGADITVIDGTGRLLVIGDKTLTIQADGAKKLQTVGGLLYVLGQNGISVFDGEQLSQYFTTSQNIVDFCHNKRLYVLTDQGVNVLIGGRLSLCCEVENPIKVEVNDGCISVLSSDRLSVFDTDGNPNSLLSFDVVGAVDFGVDYAQNAHILMQNGEIRRYKWQDVVSANLQNTTPIYTTPTIESDYSFTSNSLNVCMDKLLITTAEHTVIELSVDTFDKSDYTPKALPDLQGAQVDLLTSQNSYLLFDSQLGSSVLALEDGQVIPAYKINDGYLTVIDDDYAYVIGCADASVSPLSANYLTNNNTYLYVYPSQDLGKIEVTKGTQITAVDDAAGYADGVWCRVSYNGNTYFVLTSDLTTSGTTPVNPQQPTDEYPIEEAKPIFGKAKATRAGGTVNLYSTPDKSSQVVFAVTDGTKMQVIVADGDFYKVTYQGVSVYVHKDEIKINGLTTVQIVAIVLSVVVVAVGIMVFAITSLSKRKIEDEAMSN